MRTTRPWRGVLSLIVAALVAAMVTWALLPCPSYENGYRQGYTDGYEDGYTDTYIEALRSAEDLVRQSRELVLKAYQQGIQEGRYRQRQEGCTVRAPFAPHALDIVEGTMRGQTTCTVADLRGQGLTVLRVTLLNSRRRVAGVWVYDKAGRVLLYLVDTDCTPADVWELLPDVGVKIE